MLSSLSDLPNPRLTKNHRAYTPHSSCSVWCFWVLYSTEAPAFRKASTYLPKSPEGSNVGLTFLVWELAAPNESKTSSLPGILRFRRTKLWRLSFKPATVYSVCLLGVRLDVPATLYWASGCP